MRRRFAWLAMPMLVAAGWCPAINAATAATSMTVTATVTSSCSIAASPLAFGSYNGRQVDATAAIAAACSDGSPYVIGVDSGGGSSSPAQRELIGTGNEVRAPLRYAIYVDNLRHNPWGSTAGVDTVSGIGNGTVQSIPVYGRIAANQSPGRGIYQDAVRVTISF